MSSEWRSGKTTAERGYGGKWQRYREGWLRRHPLCVMCLERNRVVPASVVDHKQPHRGDQRLFWDPDNHQSLCKQCHDSHKQRLERSGRVMGCDERGMPIDAAHHWREDGPRNL